MAPHCSILGELPNLSMPPFPYLQNMNNSKMYLIGILRGSDQMIMEKCWKYSYFKYC